MTARLIALAAAGWGVLQAQTLDMKTLRLYDMPENTYPTYNGDYSGRRYFGYDQIRKDNVNQLKIDWMYRITGIGPQRGVGAPSIKSTPLLVDGVLYFTIPDHVFAINARTGEHIWQYDFQDNGGHLVGQRGVGMYGSWLYFLTPDGWFISLNAKDGKERWRKKVADEKLQYFTTMAPMIVKESRAGRRRRGRDGRARLSGIARSGDGRTAVALVERSGKAWRSRLGDMAKQSRYGSWRRHDMDARNLRS